MQYNYTMNEQIEDSEHVMTSPFGVSSSAFPRRGKKHSARVRSVEVSGQCCVCLDFFTVNLYCFRGREWRVSETPRVTWKYQSGGGRVLTHRPNLCNGLVKLWGSPDCLTEPQRLAMTQSHPKETTPVWTTQ